MGKGSFFPRLAAVNLARNGQFYLPYLLTVMGTGAAYYIAVALSASQDLPAQVRYAYLSMFMTIGTFVIALFAVIFLTYTHSFLMKRRKKELGLYHILGLGKGDLALMLAIETAYTAAAGIAGALALGMGLQKLVTLLLYQIMGMDAYFGFSVSPRAMLSTAVLLGVVLALDLLGDLRRLWRQDPIELLREGSAGEREPKTHRLTALVGTAALAGGYGIAVTTRSADVAFALYFVAVFLVIIGTYCLFSAVSVVVLKALRANKRFYYQTDHFIGVSGMLYRMRRNASGLASICILSTMVLVMVSGTLSLYLSSSKALTERFPGNTAVEVRYDAAAEPAFRPQAMLAHTETALDELGLPAQPVCQYRWLELYGVKTAEGWTLQPDYQEAQALFCFIPVEEAAAVTGETPELTEWTAALAGGGAVTLRAARLETALPAGAGAFATAFEPRWIAVDGEDFASLTAAQSAAFADDRALTRWQGFWNADAPTETMLELTAPLESALVDQDLSDTGAWMRMEVETRENFSADYFSLNGGFFFLGLFLGVLFIMAAVLIIYYKQVSEGYEDRERYLIMQKVGMEQRTVRRSINSQIMVVFFAPLAVAAVHVAFDYQLMTQLLCLFALYDRGLVLLCTLGTLAAFAAVYALVYWATARAYYKIVKA